MKDKKLEERLEWLEKQSNKIMAPYLENVSLAQYNKHRGDIKIRGKK